MKTNRPAEVFPKNVSSVLTLPEKWDRFSPRFFRHDDLLNDLEAAQRMDLVDLNNLLNKIHFVGQSIYVLLQHHRFEENILSRATPFFPFLIFLIA